jgi:hypothetical protein
VRIFAPINGFFEAFAATLVFLFRREGAFLWKKVKSGVIFIRNILLCAAFEDALKYIEMFAKFRDLQMVNPLTSSIYDNEQ